MLLFSHYILLWKINVNLRLLKATVEFVCMQPNYSVEVVLWFCCVVVGVVIGCDNKRQNNCHEDEVTNICKSWLTIRSFQKRIFP